MGGLCREGHNYCEVLYIIVKKGYNSHDNFLFTPVFADLTWGGGWCDVLSRVASHCDQMCNKVLYVFVDNV